MNNITLSQNSKLSKLDLWLIRIFISSVFLAQRILFIITLIHLFSEGQKFTFTYMSLSHIFVTIFSLINVLINCCDQIKISRFQRFLWEFFLFLPDSKQQDKRIVDNSVSIIIKLVFDVINNIILLVIIILCNQEKWSWIATQIVNTLIILIEYYIIESKHETFKKKISYIVTAFPLLLLLQGYLMLNIRSMAIFFYIFYLFIFAIVLQQTRLLSFIHFKLYYENQYINPFKQMLKIFFCFVIQFTIYFKFRANPFIDQYTRKYEVYNIYSVSQIIQILILYYLDKVYNCQSENKIYRKILFVCLISLFFYFNKVFNWLKKYFFEGPFCRNIQIDCQKILKLNSSDINAQYFNFEEKQLNIKIRIINFAQIEFERIFELLQKQKKALFLYVKHDRNNRQSYDSYITLKNRKIIVVSLKTEQYIESIFKIISKNIQPSYQYKFHICDNRVQNFVFYNILLNYQIIPNLVIDNQMLNPTLINYVNEIRKIVIFNKFIKDYMIHSPAQIYYDLFDI